METHTKRGAFTAKSTSTLVSKKAQGLAKNTQETLHLSGGRDAHAQNPKERHRYSVLFWGEHSMQSLRSLGMNTWFGAYPFLIGFLLCFGACNSSSDSVGVKRSAQTALHQRVFGFEEPTQDWSTTGSAVLSASPVSTQGASSLSLTIHGYTEIASIQLPAPGSSSSQASLAIQVPELLTWGDVRLIFRSPSQGHGWTDLGAAPLQGLTPQIFHTVSFSLPSSVRAALESQATDVEFRILLNAPAGSYLLDQLIVAGAEEDPSGQFIEISLRVPHGSSITQTLISSTEQLIIGDRAILGEEGALTEISHLGTQTTEFGAGVQTHAHVTSVGDVDFLRSQSRIHGRLTTSGQVLRQDNVQIDGGIFPQTPILSFPTSWSAEWPASSQPAVVRAPDSPSLMLTPGAWDAVQLYSRSTLLLRSGEYFLGSLIAEPESRIYVEASTGPVVVYVKDTLRLHTQVQYIQGRPGQLLFVYLGTDPATFEEALTASVVAPSSTIELRRPASGLAHQGSFFGKRVHVFSNAEVRHLPLDTEFLCPTGDSDGDGVLDCFDECWLDPHKTTPGVCLCGTPDTDTDGDLIPDCYDECPLDPETGTRGMCGCPSDTDVKPAGTPCNDGIVSGTFTCNGQGLCGDPSSSRPEADCELRTFGTQAIWLCGKTTGGSSMQQAASLCAQSAGGRLAQIDTAEENALYSHLVSHHFAGTPAWIGASDAQQEGQWAWLDGDGQEQTLFWTGGSKGRRVSARFSSWQGGGPEEDPAKNCATLSSNGDWSADSCHQARPYLCAFKFSSARDIDAGLIFPKPRGPGSIIPGWWDSSNAGGASTNTGSVWHAPPEGDCVPLPSSLEEFQTQSQADAQRCHDYCGPESTLEEEECANYCQGGFTPPPAGSTCALTRPPLEPLLDLIPGTCEVLDPDVLRSQNLSEEQILTRIRDAQDCSGVQRAWHWSPIEIPRCGIQTLCLYLDSAQQPRTCSSHADCESGHSCECIEGGECPESSPKFCVDPEIANACQTSSIANGAPTVDRADAQGLCAGRCFARVGCGVTRSLLDPRSLLSVPWNLADPNELCDEIRYCGGPELEPTIDRANIERSDVFNEAEELPPEPEIIPAYSQDFDSACTDRVCRDCFHSSCSREVRHPWCNNDVATADAEVQTAAFSARSANTPLKYNRITSDQRQSGPRDNHLPVGFRVQPDSALEFGLEPLPFGAARFKARAAVGVKATVDFNVLGTKGSVDLVNLRAEISASLCHVTTADSRLEVVGVDFLPKLAGDAIFHSDELIDSVDGKTASQFCEEAVEQYIEAFDRAKKALRDAQELIRQYQDLEAQGRTFSEDFCEIVAGEGKRPPGMPGACPAAPHEVINDFIKYYHFSTSELSGALQALGRRALSPSAFTQSLGVAGNGYQLFAPLDLRDSESLTLIALQFFIGPIPCLLEVTSYADYGIVGGFGISLEPQKLVSSPGRFVQVGAQAGPYANSGITLFVGVGFNLGVLKLTAGVEGGVTLGQLNLPAHVSAGLSLQRGQERTEDRTIPSDLAELSTGRVLFPRTGKLQDYAFQYNYQYGVGLEVTDILSGFLDGSLKVKFLFFSKSFKQRIATPSKSE